MSSLEELLANMESLPNTLRRKYSTMRELDRSLEGLKHQIKERCSKEIENIKRGGNPTRFSDEAIDEQKHSIRIADEKISLAVQAYDIVDTHIQHVDQYMKKLDKELQRERESAALPTTSLESGQKPGISGEGGRGRRNKTRQAMAAVAAASDVTMVAANPTGIVMDLPVDPNEPTYCICNQVSYGEMVACDNPDCKIEWFHFGCVGVKEQPKGKWYCPDCAALRNRRRGR